MTVTVTVNRSVRCYHCGTVWFPWRKHPHTCYQAVRDYLAAEGIYAPTVLQLLRIQRGGPTWPGKA